MTTDTYAPSAVGERIRELCRQFRLPTLAAETVGRFSDAGHADALPTLMEVLEQEAEDRRIRRVDRLRRASKLPRRQDLGHLRARAGSGEAQAAARQACRGRLRGQGRQRACVRYAGHRQDARDVRHRAQAGAGRTLCAVHPRIQTGAGYAGGQARPRSAADAQEAGQLRSAGHRRPGLPATGGRRVGGCCSL